MSLAPGVSVPETEKGTIPSDGKRGRYFQLNELGPTIMYPLEGGRGANAVVRRVIKACDVDVEAADVDMRALLAQIGELEVVV